MNFSLQELWKTIDECSECRQNKNQLQHILGGGKESKPDYFFVFINPTHQNISSKPKYSGPRAPFLGTKAVWKVFVQAGFLPKELLEKTNSEWNQTTIEFVLKEMKKNNLYFTNVVKCTAPHGNPPSKKAVENGTILLKKEILIVKPKLIVAMGLIPFKALTEKTIKLNDYFKQKKIELFETECNGEKFKTVPCFFPVGRGNPKKAAELLKKIKELIAFHFN